jgi:hypothetical protein
MAGLRKAAAGLPHSKAAPAARDGRETLRLRETLLEHRLRDLVTLAREISSIDEISPRAESR